MAWDASRPIPWRRLLREALIFMVVGAVALTFLVKDKSWSTYSGLLIGMAFYVVFVAILSKFGYERQTLREARERRRQQQAAIATSRSSQSSSRSSSRAAASGADQAGRARPAPTRRTSTGPTNRPRSKKRRR